MPPPAPADANTAAPRQIGRYDVRKLLGLGATSRVWLAYDPLAEREVAIKQILPHVLKDNTRGKLYRHLLVNEASLAGKLIHPHIAQIYDAAVEGDDAYIVVEYVPGGTLEQFSSRGKLLPPSRVVELMFKCTRALDYAFRNNVTHRDIKPANILLSGNGDIKISDFGAALFSSNDMTQVAGVGSPAYMSPQQVREMPLNHQTDIYSLGVVMYQLLTGQLPFTASNNYSMVYQITHVEPPPPSAYRPDIPSSLDAIVARAMNKQLEGRYATWSEFSHDLAHAFRNRALNQNAEEESGPERLRILRGMGFFADFGEAELSEVSRTCDIERVGSGTAILRDGDNGQDFYIIAEGEVLVTKRGCVLGALMPDDSFGEMALFSRDEEAHRADITARTECTLIKLNEEALQHVSVSCRMQFYFAFLHTMSERLNQANHRIATLMGSNR